LSLVEGAKRPITAQEPTLENTRRDAQTRMEGQLHQWRDRIQSLQAMIEKAGQDSATELHAALADLRKLETAGKAHIAAVEHVAASAWDAGKVDLIDRWNQVSGVFDSIWIRIRNLTR